YVTFNYVENHWVTGTLSRSAGVLAAPSILGGGALLMGSAAPHLYQHETGFTFNGEGTASVESGPIELAEGTTLLNISSVVPDDRTLGDVNLTIFTSLFPDNAEVSNGPYTLSARTSSRLKARQVRVKLTQVVAEAWRVGTIRLGVAPSSRR